MHGGGGPHRRITEILHSCLSMPIKAVTSTQSHQKGNNWKRKHNYSLFELAAFVLDPSILPTICACKLVMIHIIVLLLGPMKPSIYRHWKQKATKRSNIKQRNENMKPENPCENSKALGHSLCDSISCCIATLDASTPGCLFTLGHYRHKFHCPE